MFQKNKSFLRLLQRTFSSNIIKQQSEKTPIVRESLQFSKAKLTDFGEIATGEVPDALSYDFKFQLSKLENGLRIASEQVNSNLTTVTVQVMAGTRNECLNTSGVSQFIKSLILKGTQNKTKDQLFNELALLGGNFDVNVQRETTTFQITTLNQNTKQALLFLNEILNNSLFDKAQIEVEKEQIENLSKTNHKDQMESLIESVHYTCYRDHMIGQPILGIRENISNITQDQIKEFIKNNYTTKNTVISIAGNVNHNELVEAAKGLKFNEQAPVQKNLDQAYFTPSTMFMRDDEMINANFGVFFKAPTYKDPEFFAMNFLQAIQGEYRVDQYTGAHLNHSSRQYNLMHYYLGELPDITIHKTCYFPYQDTALFGSYLHGNEVFAQQMMFLSQFVLTEYSQYVNRLNQRQPNTRCSEQEIKFLMIYQIILVLNNYQKKLLTKYMGRRIPRSEFAKRISSIEKGYLQRVVLEKFFDTDASLVAWGPIHQVLAMSHYNRPFKRSTLGWYGSAQIHVQ